eukprot:12909553-Prorocentrum_lima.AAC.1
MEYARIFRESHRFAFRGRKKRPTAQAASTTEAKQEHSLQRPNVIPPRQHIKHLCAGDGDMEASTAPQHASA